MSKKKKPSLLQLFSGNDEKQLIKQLQERQKQKEIFKKTMGFKHGDTRSPSTKAVAARSSTPKTTKLADSGFINQRHQIRQLIRKLKGKKYQQYVDKAYKTLVKGT